MPASQSAGNGRYGSRVPRSARQAAAATLACLLGFALLAAVDIWVDPVKTADARVLSWLSDFDWDTYQHGSAGKVAEKIVFLVDPLPLLAMVALLCAYAVWRGRLLEAAAALAVVAGANLTTQVAKQLLAHDRSEPFLPNHPDPWTFPSGHVTAASSLVLAAAWVAPAERRRQVFAGGAVFVLLVGISTLVLEWHFPSDGLGGVLVALGWGFGVLAVYLWLAPRSGNPPPSDRSHASFGAGCV